MRGRYIYAPRDGNPSFQRFPLPPDAAWEGAPRGVEQQLLADDRSIGGHREVGGPEEQDHFILHPACRVRMGGLPRVRACQMQRDGAYGVGCESSGSRPPAMRPASRSTTPRAACSPMPCIRRAPSTPNSGAWCRSSPRAITSGACHRWYGGCSGSRVPGPETSMEWPIPQVRGWSERCWSAPRSVAASPGHGGCRRLASTTWKAISSPRCWSPTRPRFPSWPCSSRAGIPSSSRSKRSARTKSWGSRSTTRRGRRSTRSRPCSGSHTPAGRRWRRWPATATLAVSGFPGP